MTTNNKSDLVRLIEAHLPNVHLDSVARAQLLSMTRLQLHTVEQLIWFARDEQDAVCAAEESKIEVNI